MYCSQCGTQNANTNKFCLKCGSPLYQATPPILNTQPLISKEIIQKVKIAIFAILAIALIAGATTIYVSIRGQEDTPEKGAREWTEGTMKLEGTKIASRTCAAQQSNMQEAGAWSSAFAMLVGQQVKAEVSDLRFDTVSQSGDNAQVHVYGEVQVAVLALAQTTRIDTTYIMIHENGKWKWCGEVGIAQTITPTPPPTIPPPTVIMGAMPRLIPYKYKLDSGDGWNYWTVYFGFENNKDTMQPPELPPRSYGYFDAKDAFIETQEGKTYPVSVMCTNRGINKADEIDLRAMPGIPPGFRTMGEIEYAWGNCHLYFKAAQAAHPTVIKFPSNPDWVINLAEVPPLPIPTDLYVSNAKPISTFEGKIVLDEPGKLLVTLGKCVLERSSYDDGGYVTQGYMTYTAINRDQLDEVTAEVQFLPPRALFEEEYVWYGPALTEQISINPGQTLQYRVPLFAFRRPYKAGYLVVYQTDGKYEIYIADDCTLEQ